MQRFTESKLCSGTGASDIQWTKCTETPALMEATGQQEAKLTSNKASIQPFPLKITLMSNSIMVHSSISGFYIASKVPQILFSFWLLYFSHSAFRNGAEPYGPSTPHPRTVSSACLSSLENLSQRISLIREVNIESKENSQRRLNNNNVVIKHSQGPLVLSQGL